MSGYGLDSSFYSVLNAMNRTTMAQQQSMLRLTTGYRINKASDDPSGLIAVSQLASELTAIQAASDNATRANAMMNVADGALSEVQDMVSEIHSLSLEIANDTGMSEDEKQANQLAIDMAVASINRVLGTTTFNGKNIFSGVHEINTSGVDSSKITDVDITGRPTAVTNTTLNVEVEQAAEKAQMTYSAATVTNAVEIEVTGNLGSVSLSFASGATIDSIASSINANTAGTGVAAVASNNVLYLQSQYTGEDEFVSVDVVSGSFGLTGGVTSDTGEDAEVTINGQNTGVNGLNVTFNVNGISGTLTLDEDFASAAGGSEEFTIGSGGATFAISPSASSTFTIGISGMSAGTLGNGTLGYLSQITSGGLRNALDNPAEAARIAEAATLQVARARANVGSLQTYTVGGMQNMLSDAEEAVSSAISSIRDTDYAYETAMLTRQNILMQAQVSALSLIGQQNSSVVNLLSGF